MVFALYLFVLVLTALHIISFICAARACTKTTHIKNSAPHQPISLVRPLCGLEPFSEATLLSSYVQNYAAGYEIIFCVARADDPIIPLVHKLCVDHPAIPARLLIGEDRISQNPKLNNMVKGWHAAQYDLIAFVDSNLLLTPDYLANLAAHFDETIACVSAPPIGSAPMGLWADVECAMLNSHAARWQYAASYCRVHFAQGKTLAFQRKLIDADLIAALAQEPAEDAAVTKFCAAHNLTMRLLSPPYEQPIGLRSWRAYWGRHSRWARLRRATFPALFALEIATGLCLPLIALIIALMMTDRPILPSLVLFVTFWYGAEYIFVYFMKWHLNWRAPLSWLIRDCLIPAFYMAAWIKADFTWHGHHMTSNKQQIEAPSLSRG
jgi:ceramide glucosyltransferase